MSPRFRTGDQSLVRELNRSIVLERLWVASPLSRADLASATGLNKTTISNLVDELIAAGFVREAGRNASAGGRPGMLLELDAEAGWMIGAEIGVGRLHVVLANLRATIVWRQQVEFGLGEDLESVLDKLTSLLRQARQYSQHSQRHLMGAGVTVPGLVDVTSGRLIFEPNMGWREVPLRQLLQARLNLPVHVDNDANAAALAERYFGVAQDVDTFAYVVANIGLGAGLVMGGQLYPGVSGYAGEAGHTTIDPDGPLCRCGNRGCWERLASQRALIERLEAGLRAGEASLLETAGKDDRPALTLEAILEAARQDDPLTRRALSETAVYLGIGIANLVNLLNPKLVAFGGSLSLAHEYLLPIAREVVEARAMCELRQATKIVVSAFQSDACVIGGAALVLHELLSRPRLVHMGISETLPAAPPRRRRQAVTESAIA
jgi:predicted NBD/HSP70 family sugar kinase